MKHFVGYFYADATSGTFSSNYTGSDMSIGDGYAFALGANNHRNDS